MTEPADLIVTGGRVFCAGPYRRFATTVAVRGGLIVAVGHDDVLDLRGPGTEVIDTAGGLVTPGFTDAHVHPVQGGLERLRCDLSEHETREDYLRLVAAYAAEHPDRPWIQGGGWSMAAFPGGTPTAADLDGVVTDRPAFLPNRDHHSAWVNTRALQIAGVDGGTPDPPDGRIERDADGHPTGTLHEGAMALVSRLEPPSTEADREAALLESQSYLHSLGITAWQDAIVGTYANISDASDLYRTMARDGRLTARVVGALWWDRDRGLEQVAELAERRLRSSAGRFQATSVKIMVDGVPENSTAAMLEPYYDACGCRTSHRGLSFVDPVMLRKAVTALDAQGFQVHVHAIGDRAVRDTLDGFEAALRANGPGDRRHHVAHLQFVDPVDVPRFRELGVAANIQALWATYEAQMTDLTIPVTGEERVSRQYPFGDLSRTGATLAMGSDWPVSTPDPWQAIHVAVHRWLGETRERGAFLPEQRIGLAEAVTAYTAGSAYLNHAEHVSGTIEVGKAADLVVHDRDPFAGSLDDICETRAVATYVDGHPVG